METVTYLNGKIVCEVMANGCHEVLNRKPNFHGYPRITLNGIRQHLHRVVFMVEVLEIDELDSNVFVLHSCDNRMCSNTEHLFLGTTQDNTKDKCEKGRQTKGEGHISSKLTEPDVKLIRNLYSSKMYTIIYLAKTFGVCFSTIARIINYKIWTHI